MRGFPIRSAAAILLATTSLAFAVPAAAAGPSVRTLAAKEAHLAGMAYRMATANAGLCSRPQMMTGLIVHDLTQYQPARRAEVARAFSLRGGFGVLQLIRDGAAARSGLRIDDEIIAVGGVNVDEDSIGREGAASFRRVQGFSDLLQTRLARGSADLLIRRNGQTQHVTLTAERGCGGDLSLSNSESLNAWSDGRHIVLTTGMSDFARSDDEIAFVIAHEMAHNILGHFARSGRMGIFGAPRARNYELDADGFAVRLMSAAGYRPDAGISFLEHSRRRLWWAFSLDHPGFGSRIRTVASEISKWRQTELPYRQAIVGRPATGAIASATIAAPAPNASNEVVGATKYAQASRQAFAWLPDGSRP